MRRRVVITGLGVIAANGIGKEKFWQSNLLGKSGIRPITRFDASQFRTKIAAEVHDFDPAQFMDEDFSSKIDRFSQFAIATTKLALSDAKMDLNREDLNRVGVVMGSGLGGMFFYEKQILTMQEFGHSKTHPAAIPRVMPNAPAGQIAIEFKLKGPNLTISTACASGSHAIGQALELILNNKADMILACGTEAPLAYYNFAGFDALRVMTTTNDQSQKACRPFDKMRDGFAMGEGAGILILEELDHAINRGAKIYAELVGYSLTSGAQHIVVPLPDGEDASQTMILAIKEAGIAQEDVDYINAHGTATQANDRAETLAIKKVFGKRAYKIPISSTKSMIGHTLGAAGAIEALVCCLSIENNLIPPTIGYEHVDPDCDLDYVPNVARKHEVNIVLSNSFAFGGNNTTLVFKSYER